MMYLFENCKDLIRTLPLMQHDQHRPEDINTKQEDHAVDELRYASMSRSYQRPIPEIKEDMFRPPTIDEMMAGLDNATQYKSWRL